MDLSPFVGTLRTGLNVFAIEVHNQALDSSDLSMIPTLHTIGLPEPPGALMLLVALPFLRWMVVRRAVS